MSYEFVKCFFSLIFVYMYGLERLQYTNVASLGTNNAVSMEIEIISLESFCSTTIRTLENRSNVTQNVLMN